MTGPVEVIGCRFCGSATGEVVLDLGAQPAADQFPPMEDPGPDPCHPLRMWLCAECRLAQLVEDATTTEEPRGTEPQALISQAGEAVRAATDAGLLRPGMTLVEYPSPHGGSWLPHLVERGLQPAADGAQADVVLDNFGIMHEPDQRAGFVSRVRRLSPDGVLLLQYHSLAAILTGGQWNALRHGHFAYYSTPAIVEMVEAVGWRPVHAFSFPLYGGTILLAATRSGDPDRHVLDVVEKERTLGVTRAAAVRTLGKAARESSDALAEFLSAERAAGRKVLGYSAASRSVALLNHAGIGPHLLPAIADASVSKQGRRLPGSRVPVISPSALVTERPDTVLLFVDDLLPEVRSALPAIEAQGGRWLTLSDLLGEVGRIYPQSDTVRRSTT